VQVRRFVVVVAVEAAVAPFAPFSPGAPTLLHPSRRAASLLHRNNNHLSVLTTFPIE
jgi:hypothetical protein